MKLISLAVLAATVLAAGAANAQFNRIGNSASVNMAWTQVDANQSNDWQGFQLTSLIPVGDAGKVFDQPIRFNLDLTTSYLKADNINTNFGTAGVGGTFWINDNYDSSMFKIAPYFRAGVNGNSGNFQGINKDYWSYALEPGLVVKYDSLYGLVGYRYGEGFNADFGSVVNMVTTGVGLNLTKSFSVEAKYDMNRGSNDYNQLIIGGVYKFN
jgi:hypothetical protein